MIEGLEHNNSKLPFFRILVMLANNWYIIILWNNNNLRFKVALFFFHLVLLLLQEMIGSVVCVFYLKKSGEEGIKTKRKMTPVSLEQ